MVKTALPGLNIKRVINEVGAFIQFGPKVTLQERIDFMNKLSDDSHYIFLTEGHYDDKAHEDGKWIDGWRELCLKDG